MNKHPDPLDWVGDLFAMLARDWGLLISEINGNPEYERAMRGLVANTVALEQAGLMLDEMEDHARAEGRSLSADALGRICLRLYEAAARQRVTGQVRSSVRSSVEFLGMDEVDAANVVWSGQADDDSALVLVKHLVGESEFVVAWFTEHEWQRVDGTARQWMFEYDPAASSQFDSYTDEGEAVAAAKAALTEYCGEAWS